MNPNYTYQNFHLWEDEPWRDRISPVNPLVQWIGEHGNVHNGIYPEPLDGLCRLRVVGIQNMPHIPTPSMQELAWDYLRRFSRDPATGHINEQF